MKLSKKKIIEVVSKETGVLVSDIGLFKDSGSYYWSGKAGACFSDCCVYINNLEQFSLDRWVDDFKDKEKETLRYSDYKTLADYIKSIDWNVE